jgi:hypothetical protein
MERIELEITQATTDISPYRDEPSGSQTVSGYGKEKIALVI